MSNPNLNRPKRLMHSTRYAESSGWRPWQNSKLTWSVRNSSAPARTRQSSACVVLVPDLMEPGCQKVALAKICTKRFTPWAPPVSGVNITMKQVSPLTVKDVASELKFTRAYIHYLTDTGRLTCRRASNGRRLFTHADVRQYRRRRRQVLEKKLRAVG